jgi:hypothetical protein
MSSGLARVGRASNREVVMRTPLLAVVLVLGTEGCFTDPKTTVIQPGLYGRPVMTQTSQAPQAAATKEVALRVATLGQKIVADNPQIGLRPVFNCIGVPQPTVFHRLNKDQCEIFISEGLVKQCQTDGQLAAVLCQELGKVGSERTALATAALRLPERDPPMDLHIGSEIGGSFGPSDGTNRAELARLDDMRKKRSLPPSPPPAPEVLARAYLTRAGFAADDLQAVAPLLRAAEGNTAFEKQMNARP